MKRDIELVKLILEHFEAKEDWHHEKGLRIPGYEFELTQYHLQIMYEAGFINAEPIQTAKGRLYDLLPFRLTWKGHEFLDTIRGKNIWPKIKEMVKSKGGQLSFELIKQIAGRLVETELMPKVSA